MLPCVLPMIIHRQTWNQNKIPDSKKTVSDTDTITCWDQRKNVQITDEYIYIITLFTSLKLWYENMEF